MKHPLYTEFVAVAKELEEKLNLTVESNHDDIRTFLKGDVEIFKLLIGTFETTGDTEIVVSFHVALKPVETIGFYRKIDKIYPWFKLVECYIDDDMGETYLGEDAETLYNLFIQQEVLSNWFEKKTEDDAKEFVGQEIVGRERDLKRSYSSIFERDEALLEFERMAKPLKTDEVH
jgi:hypothetical protein